MSVSFGSGDYFSIPQAQGVLTDASWTIACWFRLPNITANNEWIYTEALAFNQVIQIGLITDGSIIMNYRNTGFEQTKSSSSGYDDDTWYRLAVMRRGNADAEIFIDGVSAGTLGTSTESTNTTASVTRWIGNNTENSGQSFTGSIARFAIWNSDIGIDATERFLLGGQFNVSPNILVEGYSASAPVDLSPNKATITVGSTPSVTVMPPMWYPSAQILHPPERRLDVSGTVTASIDEADIVTGGKMIELDLHNNQWVSS